MQKLCVENNFACVNRDNIQPRQHWSYGGVHLNTTGSKVLAENFILALSRQTWLGIIRDNDALIGNVSETESNSETTKYLPEDSLESKSDNHENDENVLSERITLKTLFWTNKCEFNQKQIWISSENH